MQYQATSSSTYYREHHIKISIQHYPLLCLTDVKVTPHVEMDKINMRIWLLNYSPHTVNIESNGEIFVANSRSDTKKLLSCPRTDQYPKNVRTTYTPNTSV